MIFVVILWIIWTTLLVITVFEISDEGMTKSFVIYLLVTIALFTLFIFITVKITEEIQFDGAQKYLDKEIVINKFNVQYDSQNQPIDTTYTFKYNK